MNPPNPAPVDPIQAHTRTTSVMEFGSAIMGLAKRSLWGANSEGEEAVVSESTATTMDATLHQTNHVHLHFNNAFQDCLNTHEFDDMGKCQYYVDVLTDCCKQPTS